MKKKTQQKGITLVALVVTIIILLILAGVIMIGLTGESGILKNTEKAAEEHGRAKGLEQIQLVLEEDAIVRVEDETNPALDEKRLLEIFRPEKEKWVESVVGIDDKEGVRIINKEGYIYDVIVDEKGKVEIVPIGKNTEPIITSLNVTNKKTNSVSVEVKTMNVEKGANYIYWYKKESEENYTQAIEGKDITTYTYAELETNIEYNLKVEIEAKKGNPEKEINVLTEEMPEGVITFTNTRWSNGKANVTINTMQTEYILQYQIGGINGDWTTITSGEEITEIEHNSTVYGRLWDGTNGTEPASVDIQDETIPNIVSVSIGTITSSTAELIVIAEDKQTGLAEEKTYKYYLGEELKAETTESRYTYIELEEGTKQTLKVKVIDKAGNEAEKWVEVSMVPGEGAIIFSNAIWNNGEATITVSTNTDYEITYQKNSTEGEWKEIEKGGEITGLTHGDTIYARLYNGTNYGDWASIIIEDTTIPEVEFEITSGKPGTTGWSTSDVVVKITGKTTGSALTKVTYTLSGATTKSETTITNGETITITAEGETTITAYAYTAAKKSAAETLTIKKDTIAPTIISEIRSSNIKADRFTLYTTPIDTTSGIYSARYMLRREEEEKVSISWTKSFKENPLLVEERIGRAFSKENGYTITSGTYIAYVVITDTAGNQSVSPSTGTISIVVPLPSGLEEGIITFGQQTWSNGKANVTVNTSQTSYTLQYQIGGIEEGKWTTITNGGTVSGISNLQTVYARLWDGTNGGEHASVIIEDEIEPEIRKVETSQITNHSIKVTVTAEDGQTGLATYQYYLDGILKKEDTNSTYTFDNLEVNKQYKIKVVVIDKAGNIITKEITEATANSIANGTWNEAKKVNTPNLEGTGLIPIYFEHEGWDAGYKELNDDSLKEEWDSWYDYDNNKWANAISKDGSFWVWIPRYAYKITSNLGTSTAGTIEVKFLKGTDNKDENGTTISKTYPTVTNNAMKDYVVHPSFTNGTSNKWQNGEWNDEIEGFWVAKYEAGFQSSTIDYNDSSGKTLVNGNDKVVYSELKYSQPSYENIYSTNALSQDMTSVGYANEKISYPVFKPLTYSYNVISANDSYRISKEVQKADFYGLKNIDSHMMKNSEWGALVYLSHSKYGTDAKEISHNNKNLEEKDNNGNFVDNNLNGLNGKYIFAVTGYAGNNAPFGVTGNSTYDNKSGVYDLSGGTFERVTAYITNQHSYLGRYGASYAHYATAENNPSTRSTEYATAYPYNSGNDTAGLNWTNLYNFKKTKFGDAILEISSVDSDESKTNSWFADYSIMSYGNNPFLLRGGATSIEEKTTFADIPYNGIFAFYATYGAPGYTIGFRVVLIPN